MRRQLFLIAIGSVCGYLMISWVPNVTPFVWANFITDFIFRPLRSFLAMICFFVGFLANAAVIRTFIEGMIRFIWKQTSHFREWFASCGIIGSFYWLFQLNARLALLFFIFSVVYGMISIDFAGSRRYKKLL
ncbi:hypothetical protein HNQ34_000518 [Anoxybacillus tepidamans]|uniref:Uncharacterized protein n=1 Tax=Anoxybacteroides tepidamans TaxID=265948 RepID=A0A7W8MUQ1_9BACL|nr:hypothetical protein [Anoxybacillus tepidamans]MBB5323441.1 hypothetical protein [Anoxybacillus tepidamans]